jgi:nucleoid DNA-binding protein
VTKKEIVKQISDAIEETQLKTKKIVQKTFDAIVKTLVREGRIELRNFGVFEVKKRRKRKARNPRTGEPVQVPEKYVVTFKPGKKMEELVAQMTHLPDFVEEHDEEEDEEEGVPVQAGVGGGDHHDESPKQKPGRTRKTT